MNTAILGKFKRWWSTRSSLQLAGFFILMAFSASVQAGSGSIDPGTGIMNFEVNFRFVPSSAQIQSVKTQIGNAADMVCDATDGEIKFGEITLTGGSVSEADGDIWILPQTGRSGLSLFLDGSNLGRAGRHINLYSDDVNGNVIAHEMHHHAFGILDEYGERGRCIGKNFKTSDDAADTSVRKDDSGNSSNMQATGWTEFSVASNHDLNRGVLPYYLCSRVKLTDDDVLDFNATVDEAVAVSTFDNTSFETAKSTSASPGQFALRDSLDQRQIIRFYVVHSAADTWDVHFAIDDGEIDGGTAGDYRDLGSVQIELDDEADDGSRFPLVSITPDDFELSLTNLANGADDLSLPLHFGEVNETDGVHGNPGICIDDGSGGCLPRWDPATENYELTQQTAGHRKSDWETLVANYPFVTAPSGLPAEVPPTGCRDSLTFTEEIIGSDQVILFIDRSGSMRAPISEGADSNRLDFAKAAARAFIDLQAGMGVDVGMISFNEASTLERPMELLDAADAEPFKMRVDNLEWGGNTGIGTALQASVTEFQRAALIAEAAGEPVRSRTAFLLSDGENNRGEDPDTVADRLRAMDVQIFSIPVGDTADREFLGELAMQSGGDLFDAPDGDELPPIYAELFARYRGESLAMGRQSSFLEPLQKGGNAENLSALTNASTFTQPQTDGEEGNPYLDSFSFQVEQGSERLNLFLSGRNEDIATWSLLFRLTAPDGTEYTSDDTDVIVSDTYYTIIRVPEPAAGIWRFDMASANQYAQSSYVQAHVENKLPDLFVDVKPDVVSDLTTPAVVSVEASWVTTLGDQVDYTGFMRRPDGSTVPLALSENLVTGTISGEFDQYAGRGIYQAVVTATVGDNVQRQDGEVLFGDPASGLDDVEAFTRTAQGGFFLDIETFPPCTHLDCDGDGIPNHIEGSDNIDTDGDGLPDYRDDDADGDDVPDIFESTADTDHDGYPDFQDPDADNDGIADGNDPTLDHPDACCKKNFWTHVLIAVLLLLILLVLLMRRR